MSVIYHGSHWFSAHEYLFSAIRAAQEARIHAAQQRAENIMTQFNDCVPPPPNSFTPVSTTSHHVIKEVHPVLPMPSNAAEYQHSATGHLVPDVSPAPKAPQVTSPGNSSFCMLHSNSCSGCMIEQHQIADLQEMLRLSESKISKLQKLSSQGNITNVCPVKYLVTALNLKVCCYTVGIE